MKRSEDSSPRQPFVQEKMYRVLSDLAVREYQEHCALQQAKEHNMCDAEIRGFLKRISDYFRQIENFYIRQEQRSEAPGAGGLGTITQ